MPAFTVKNIPDDLFVNLKQTAEIHKRSMNSEILFCLESMLLPKRKLTPSERLSRVESLRSAIPAGVISCNDINDAINSGRP